MEPTYSARQSFIDVAPSSHFPIQNLPFGAFQRSDNPAMEDDHVGVRIGDLVLDLTVAAGEGLIDAVAGLNREYFFGGSLNRLLAAGRPAWSAVRAFATEVLGAGSPVLRDDSRLRGKVLVDVDGVTMRIPADIGDYTDFYSSKEHATNVGIMFRGAENALMPNWTELPVAYHGRASSVVVSGTPVRRPSGQTMPEGAERPVFGPSRRLDFELEMGFFVGPGNELAHPIPIAAAPDHIFGLVLVNDWSARDIQSWEYRPLGPFNAKNFATTISPWVVTLEALEPFRCAGPVQAPVPLEYLRSPGDWSYDIQLEVRLQAADMADSQRVCLSNFRHMYWNICQQLAHHTVTGCNVRPGDLMGSGTISAPDPEGYGSMLELSWSGSKPIRLADGEVRSFLEDGDRVTISGWCDGDGYRIGFGEAVAEILPAG